MTGFNYPPLRIGLLHALLQLKERFDADETILEGSPYDPETVALLRDLFKAKVVEKRVEVEVQTKVKAGRGRPTKDVALSAEDQEKLRGTIQDLIKELEELGDGSGEGEGGKNLPTGERIQIIKTKGGLLDQLLKQQERVFNIKRMSEFQEVVIAILDDLVSEEDREIFLKRLEPYRD